MRGLIASLVLVPSLSFATAACAQGTKPTDLDKVVPADALVHVTVDGIDPVKAALVDLLNAIMPGMGGMMIEGSLQQIMQQPGMSEIDTTKQFSFTFLPNETSLIAAPLKNSDAFEKALKDSGDADVKSIIPGEGASLLALGGEVKLDDLRKAGNAKSPSLSGPIRGFVNMKGLYSKYHDQIESALAMVQAMAAAQSGGGTPPNIGEMIKGFATDVPRIDFAFIPSKSGLEIATALTPAPESKGFVATIAKAQPSSAANKLTGAIPSDSVAAFTGTVTPEMAAAYSELVTTMASNLSADAKAQIKAFADKAIPMFSGDFAGGASMGADGSFSMVMALSCSDKEKYRSMVKEVTQKDGPLMKALASLTKGATISYDYKQAAETIDGNEIDHVIYHIAANADADAATKKGIEMAAKMMSQPARIAFGSGYLVAVMGGGGPDKIKATLASLKSGGSTSAAAKALPSGTTFAVAINLVEYLKLIATMAPPEAAGMLGALKNLPAGKDYMTFTATPKSGAAEMRLNIPAGGIQSIVMGMQGGAMGGGPK